MKAFGIVSGIEQASIVAVVGEEANISPLGRPVLTSAGQRQPVNGACDGARV